jgi:capsular polysaccharide biosynthesis protein
MNQQPQPTSLYPVERGDELSLTELWKVLVEYKLLIIVFTALTTLYAIYYASTLPTIYKAEVLMIPASGGVSSGGLSNRLGGLADMAGVSLRSSSAGVKGEQALARLKTRSFLINHIKEKNLKPILFADQWDRVEKKWIDKEPSDRDSADSLKSMIEAGSHPRSKAGLASLSIAWKNPHNPNKIADIANELVSDINFKAKQRANLEAKNSISFLEKELEQTSILKSQTIIYSLIEQQMGKIMVANIRDEFVFKVIDPAVVPKHAETKPILMVVFIGLILGIFLASFLAISTNYFKGSLQKIT